MECTCLSNLCKVGYSKCSNEVLELILLSSGEDNWRLAEKNIWICNNSAIRMLQSKINLLKQLRFIKEHNFLKELLVEYFMCMNGKNKCFWLTRFHSRCGTKWELPKTAVFILMKWPKQWSLVNISVIMASHVDVDNASLVIFCCWFVCCCCFYHFHNEQTSRISLLHCQAFQEQKLGSGQCPVGPEYKLA